MATLTINFTPAAGATDYEVCYKATSSPTYICQTVASSPAVITSGIVCGQDYDVRIRTNCSNGATSAPATTLATQLACPPPPETGTCYTVHISTEDATSNYIQYQEPNSGSITQVTVNSLTLSGGFYDGAFCSTIPVELVDSGSIPLTLTGGSTISAGGICNTSIECAGEGEPPQYYAMTLSGVGDTACTEQSVTLWSDCTFGTFGVGCFLFLDSSGTPLTGETQAWVNGTLWDVDPVTGRVDGVSSTQC